jgi:glutamate synthase (NADPH/NADH) small chain
MGSIEGFLKIERQLPDTEKPESRTKHFKEFYKPNSDQLTKEQSARCMDCGVPFCHNGCPLGNFIPDFNDAVYREQWEEAAKILLSTNNFPEFTGRICPAPCEGSCVLGINKPPVAIEHIEKSIIEKAFERGYIKPQTNIKRNGKKVAIVGSGPAGLAAADQLNKAGYQVTVFERHEKPGGLLRFGIPDFKLEKSVVERRIALMEQEGIEFKTNTEIGNDLAANELFTQFEGILLATGATIPRDLEIRGREFKGIHFAMDFLTQQNRKVSKLEVSSEPISAEDKHVIVIGGGDTGSDCIGTSNRQGAKSIVQFELLQKPGERRSSSNPWPEWPLVLRNSSSHEEGCEREWSILTKRFIGNEEGLVTGIETVQIKWEDGKFQEIPGTEKVYTCDLVLLAIGFTHTQHEGMINQLNLELDQRGNTIANKYQTKIPNVFVAGDMRRGQSLVVWAISEGREAARSLDNYLSGKSILPSKSISEYQVS